MISSRFVRYFAIVLTTTLALGCAESVTGPSVPTPAPQASSPIAAPTDQDLLLGGLLGGIINALTDVVKGVVDPGGIPVAPVRWADSHVNQARSVSGTIGYWGGTLSIPGSDFSITFPVGALSRSTNITIVSDASGFVSYDMQPHGLQFNKPVVVTQRLKNTRANEVPDGQKLFGAYFEDESLLGGLIGGLLDAVEIATSITLVRPDGTAEVQTWLLNHFSRWMLASG